MIEVQNLVKNYGKKEAVKNINFKINEGEIVGFLGPNGAGKTTTMNIITGYISATSGKALINGIDVLDNPEAAKKNIGYLPEQPPLYNDMTVKEYLNFICDIKGVLKNRQKHIDEICNLVGISNVYKRLNKNLSKGYRQRVGLAQALINNPETLILDEPTVGLDPKQIIEIRNLIKNLGKKRTIILSSHILPEVSAVCERILMINNGIIVANDTPNNLSKKFNTIERLECRISGAKNVVLKLLTECDGIKKVIPTIQNEPDSFDFMIETEDNADIRKTLSNLLSRNGHHLLMLQPIGATLEEIFIKLTRI